MYAAERNRKLKSVLSSAFRNHKVSVRGHRGTAYGWVTVSVQAAPIHLQHRRRMEAKVWRIIGKHDIKIGSYGTPGDMGCDYGWGREIHINFTGE